MKSQLHRYLFIILLNIYLQLINASNMKILIKSLSNMDCDKGNQNVFQGVDLFKGTAMTQSIQKVSISGWISLRGYENKYYTILSIFEDTNGLIILQYNLSNKRISITSLLLYQEYQIANLVKNQWIFFYAQAENNSGPLIATAFIYINQQRYDIPVINQNTPSINFNKNLIKVSVGLPSNSYGQDPSCSFIKNFVFYWDYYFHHSYVGNILYDISSVSSEILWNFDFVYNKMNQGQLISLNDNKITKLELKNGYMDNYTLKKGIFFTTDYINISEYDGLTLSFDIYLEDYIETGNSLIFSVNFLNGQTLSFYADNHDQIIVVYQFNLPEEQIIIEGYMKQKWFNMLVILKSGYQDMSFLLINSDDFPSQNLIAKSFNSPLAYIQFGHINSKRDMKLNNLIFIKGSYLQDINNCSYSLRNTNDFQECLLCKPSYLIDMEDKMDCSNSSILQLIDEGYKKSRWYRSDCPRNMVNLNGVCVCGDQFYGIFGDCIRCPFFCDGCIDGFTCKNMADLRLLNNECPFSRFDDGQSCLEQKLQAQTKIEKVELKYNNPSFICNQGIDQTAQYSFTADQIQYQNQQSILFTFSFRITDLSQTIGVISVVKDINQGEILTIVYFSQSLNLYLKGVLVHMIKINPFETFMVGIWKDQSRLIIFVYTNAQIIQKETSLLLSASINLQFCIGPCKSSIIPNYLCGDLSDRPFTVIYNIPYELIKSYNVNDFIHNYQQYPLKNDIIEQILAEDQIRLALFRTKETRFYPPQQYFYDNMNQLDFSLTITQIHEEMGFKITQYSQGMIKLSQQQSFPFTISMYLYLDHIVQAYTFVSYEINGFSIIYQFVPQDEGTIFSIRICVDQICKDTAYSKLFFQQSNHLMIIPMNKSKFSTDISLIEFEIACNYMRESLNFLNILKPISPTSQIKIFQNLRNANVMLYVNKIRIYTGDGAVSFNTDNSNNCFIFGNLEQTNCIFPKKGFVTMEVNTFTHEEIAISIEECFKMNELQSSGVYTYNIRSYINECFTICKHPYTDYNKQCECIEGYFSEVTTDGQTICSKCNDKCQTCQGTKDNCILCAISHLQGPSCDCSQINTYLDSTTNTCLPCFDKCSSCVDKEDNCITCSENRINPPLCSCDQRYYKEEGGKCIEIKCSDKCEKCEDKPNYCVQCKSGRYSPPDCFCQENYQEIATGECIPCPQFTYYESISNSCIPCDKPCLECSKNKNSCTSCINGFLLNNFQCLCPNGKKGQDLANGQIVCLNEIDVTVNLINKKNYYQFIMIFTQEIEEIQQLKEGNYEEILDFYIPQIDKKYYTLTDFVFNKEEITFKITLNSNFVATQAFLIIQQCDIFKNIDSKSVLQDKYKNLPFNFDIGPNLFTEDSLSNENIDNTIDFLKNQNSEELKILQQLQLVLYLLNTVQPSSLFLLLQAQLPPNLYKFCQIFGLLIFPSVSDYQSSTIQEEKQLFGLDLNESEVYPDCQFAYSRLGFSNSLLINIPIIVVKYLVIFLFLGIIQLITLINFHRGNRPIFSKIKSILIQRLNTENEINLLLTTLSILLQFRCVDENSYASRYGLYLAIGFLMYIIAMMIFNYRIINLDINKNYYSQNDLSVYSILFTERIQPTQNNKYQRNYFFMQLLKKYLQIIILFMFYPFPYLAAPLCGILLLASSILTIILQPYKNQKSRIIKIIGELILSICWFLCIFFPKLENQFNRNNVISNDLFEKYMKVGSFIVYLLMAFNILFILELIFSTIQTIAQLFKKQPKQFQHPKLVTSKQILR